MHPAELLQGVFGPEVVPIIEMRPKVSHGRDYQDGVVRRAMGGGRQPRHGRANLAKPANRAASGARVRRCRSFLGSGERNEWRTGTCR